MMKFKESEALRNGISAIMNYAAQLKRGDVVPYAVMASLSGIPINSDQWRTLCHKLIRTMERRRKITLWAIENTGYRMLTVAEQISDNTRRRARKMRRQGFFGIRSLRVIPASEMTIQQRQLQQANISTIKGAMKEANRSARFVEAQMSGTGMPQRRPRKPLREAIAESA